MLIHRWTVRRSSFVPASSRPLLPSLRFSNVDNVPCTKLHADLEMIRSPARHRTSQLQARIRRIGTRRFDLHFDCIIGQRKDERRWRGTVTRTVRTSECVDNLYLDGLSAIQLCWTLDSHVGWLEHQSASQSQLRQFGIS